MQSETLTAALGWLDRGVAPIPILAGTKHAAVAWKVYQDRLPSREIVRQWFSNGHGYNLGVIGGGINHLAVLDFDELTAYDRWQREHRDLAQTFTVHTPRGKHAYFFLNEAAPTQYLDGVEVRSIGGYVLCPPSIHPSGAPYIAEDPRAEIVRTSLAALLDGPLPCILSVAGDTPSGGTATPNTRYVAAKDRADLIGEIRRGLPVLNLVSRYTAPRASSNDGRWFLASCPFKENHAHGDAHPSFWIDAVRQKAGCFAPKCRALHRTMDVIDLYARVNHLDNRAAIFALADELNLCSFVVVLDAMRDVRLES